MTQDKAHLFEVLQNSYLAPMQLAEPLARYLGTSTRPEFKAIRTMMGDWFERYPEDDKPDLRGRLHSASDRVLSAAFWELFLHEWLLRQGYEVTVHPSMPGTSNTPDFLVRSGDKSFYLEARLVTEATNDELASARRRDRVYDKLNERLTSKEFSLWAVDHDVGQSDPSVKLIVSHLRSWLKGLDAREEFHKQSTGVLDLEDLPTTSWEADGWRLEFRAIAISVEEASGAEHRMISAMGGGMAQCSVPEGRLKAALHQKSGRYGEHELPFVIAISCVGDTVDRMNLMCALLGSDRARVSLDKTGKVFDVTADRARNGFWVSGRGPLNTRVSAVLAIFGLLPSRVGVREPLLVHNPYAAIPLKNGPSCMTLVPDMRSCEFEEIASTIASRALFGLPANWPRSSDEHGACGS